MSYLLRLFENASEAVTIPNPLTFSGAVAFTGALNLAGATVTGMTLTGSVVAPDTDDGAALGSTSLKWSDLFLASGAVINFNGGDVTLTHSSNLLTLAGGGLAIAGNVALSGTTSTLGALDFSSITTPADAGNYGSTLNCGWVAIDPGSGGSFGAKLMFSNTDTSGYVLYGLGLRCRSYAASAKVVGLNVSASAAVVASGQVIGGQFYLQNSGSYTIVGGGGYPSAALYCKSWLAAACDKASALWIDDESSVKPTTQYMVDITMNGSTEVDKVFHIYGGDPGADTFIDFDTCDQGAGAFVVATGSGGATRSHRIKCTVNGSTVGYMSLYTD